MRFTSARRGLAVFAVFVAVSLAASWPLPLHLATHLTGAPEGDTGVYVWNQWVFHKEIVQSRTTPLSTREILSLDGPTDLSLHNYTVFSDLLALPLQDSLGVIRTFNVTYLINFALAGFFMYLLARRLTGRTAEAVLAGLMFACAPFLLARGEGHFSLAAAAPLPAFMLALYRAWDLQRVRDAALAGVALAWAAFCDPYFAVFCVILGTVFLGSRVFALSLVRRVAERRRGVRNLVDVALVLTAGLIIVVHVLGNGSLQLGPARISMRTLYTPMLVLTLLGVLRVWLSTDVRITSVPVPSRRFVFTASAAAVVAAAVLMSPTLYAVGARLLEDGFESAPVLWRSSATGVDLLAYAIPNPAHPLAPDGFRAWLDARPQGFAENVASISWIGLAVILFAWRALRAQFGRLWVGIALMFGLMSIGPFLTIAGVNTFIPGPWALLRYVPVIGAARMPGRMSIVVMMALCVLFAMALTAIGRRYPQRRRQILIAAGVLLAFELCPAPRTLYAATPPSIYDIIAADPRPVRVLQLPTGVRDGTWSIGDFAPSTQFYQTYHGKGLLGGYLSRVSRSTRSFYRRAPVISSLIEISEGRKLSPSHITRAMGLADDFMRNAKVGYVVMHTDRTSADLRDFATTLLGLKKIAEADGYELYVPKAILQ